MKKFLLLVLLIILITANLNGCNSSENNDNSSQSKSSSSSEVSYASDSVRYDCNGYPLNQYNHGKWSFGETFGASNKPYRTQITEIVTSNNSTEGSC